MNLYIGKFFAGEKHNHGQSSILSGSSQEKRAFKDNAFYCAKCDVTSNSASQWEAHLGGDFDKI